MKKTALYNYFNIERTDKGKYIFGTKKIIAKIVNDKLMIRVGGGYMKIHEFLQQYGEMELMKVINDGSSVTKVAKKAAKIMNKSP